MNSEQRAEIEARLAAATPGPWQAFTFTPGPHPVVVRLEDSDGDVEYPEIGRFHGKANALLAAHAPADIRALLDRVQELETIVRVARQRLYDAHGRGPETVAEVIRAVGAILRRANAKETPTNG